MMALSSTVSLTACGAWRYGSGPLQVVLQEYAGHTATYRINDLPDGGLSHVCREMVVC